MAKKSIRFEIDEELHRKAKIKSAVTGQTIADFLREKLRKWVNVDHPIILPEAEPDKPLNQVGAAFTKE